MSSPPAGGAPFIPSARSRGPSDADMVNKEAEQRETWLRSPQTHRPQGVLDQPQEEVRNLAIASPSSSSLVRNKLLRILPGLPHRRDDAEPQRSHTATVATPPDRFSEHRWWDPGEGWKHILNNLRLILQPYVYYCLLLTWLLLFDIPGLRVGFQQLIGIMNSLHASLPT